MDEFARIMGMEGVRPLEKPKGIAGRVPGRSSKIATEVTAGTALSSPGGHAWASGPRARTALETALERLAIEFRDGRRGWATGIRQDGTTVTLPASSGAAALLGTADRQSLRLMVVGGEGWTFVMHPLMGVATLDEDPVEPG